MKWLLVVLMNLMRGLYVEPGVIQLWGSNDEGQLAAGTSEIPDPSLTVAAMDWFEVNNVRVDSVWASSYCSFAFALSDEGQLYSWGYGVEGEMGTGGTTRANFPPAVASLVIDERFTKIDGGFDYVMALTTDGRVFVWGAHTDGQLGIGVGASNPTLTPTILDHGDMVAGDKTVDIAAGKLSAYLVSEAGRLFGWGLDEDGSIAQTNDPPTDQFEPRRISVGAGIDFVGVSGCEAGGVALTSEGVVYSWGRNTNWVTGLSEDPNNHALLPEVVTGLDGENVIKVVCSQFNAYALTSDGKIFAWGSNSNLGTGSDADTTAHAYSPREVVAEVEQFVDVDAGFGHAVALDSTGKVWTWGLNDKGQLGTGTVVNEAFPRVVAVDDTLPVTSIAAGWYSSYALNGWCPCLGPSGSGSCEEPGLCICEDGYTGEYCTVAPDVTGDWTFYAIIGGASLLVIMVAVAVVVNVGGNRASGDYGQDDVGAHERSRAPSGSRRQRGDTRGTKGRKKSAGRRGTEGTEGSTTKPQFGQPIGEVVDYRSDYWMAP